MPARWYRGWRLPRRAGRRQIQDVAFIQFEGHIGLLVAADAGCVVCRRASLWQNGSGAVCSGGTRESSQAATRHRAPASISANHRLDLVFEWGIPVISQAPIKLVGLQKAIGINFTIIW